MKHIPIVQREINHEYNSYLSKPSQSPKKAKPSPEWLTLGRGESAQTRCHKEICFTRSQVTGAGLTNLTTASKEQPLNGDCF